MARPHTQRPTRQEKAETIAWLMNTLEYKTPGALFTYLDTLNLDEAAALLAEAPAPTPDGMSEGLAAATLCPRRMHPSHNG